jgi:hypothetical protein
MRRQSTIAVGLVTTFAVIAMAVWVQGNTPKGEVLEYKVMSIEPKDWVVTAEETATGNVVKFRMPPAVFKGKTFNANLDSIQPGQRFSVRGPRNAQLSRLIVEKPLAKGPGKERGPRAKLGTLPGEPLLWKILHVDARRWIVTAQNRQSRKIIKFRVKPESFTGFRFHANLRGLRKGEGFSIVAPNDVPINNNCTLLESSK